MAGTDWHVVEQQCGKAPSAAWSGLVFGEAMFEDAVDGILHGNDLLGVFVGDLYVLAPRLQR